MPTQVRESAEKKTTLMEGNRPEPIQEIVLIFEAVPSHLPNQMNVSFMYSIGKS